MRVAKAEGRLHGRKPKLTAKREAHLAVLVGTGKCTTLEVAELFTMGRSTVYRAIHRAGARAGASVWRRVLADTSVAWPARGITRENDSVELRPP